MAPDGRVPRRVPKGCSLIKWRKAGVRPNSGRWPRAAPTGPPVRHVGAFRCRERPGGDYSNGPLVDDTVSQSILSTIARDVDAPPEPGLGE
jgi:hypothetical protein